MFLVPNVSFCFNIKHWERKTQKGLYQSNHLYPRSLPLLVGGVSSNLAKKVERTENDNSSPIGGEQFILAEEFLLAFDD